MNKKNNHKDTHDRQIGSVTLSSQLSIIHLPRLLLTVGGANMDMPSYQEDGVSSDEIDICRKTLETYIFGIDPDQMRKQYRETYGLYG